MKNKRVAITKIVIESKYFGQSCTGLHIRPKRYQSLD